jgi:glycosyltransferase involved in cell wall biosynthesis
MRILLATGVFPPRIGGPSRQVHDLANALLDAGQEVAVLTFGDRSRIENSDRVKVYYVQDKFRIFKLLRRYLGIRKMLRIINKEFKPEIIQSNNVRFLAYVVGSFAKKNKIPSLTKYAGDFVYEKINVTKLLVPEIENVFKFNTKAKLFTLIEKKILRNFDFIWAQSQYQRKILEKYLDVRPEKIVVMPNYINILKKNKPEEVSETVPKFESKRKIILSTSRFVPWKNVEAQIFVMKKLKEISHVPFFLYLVGGGDKAIQERVRRLIKEKSLVNEIKILPQVSPLETEKIFDQADVYLSTSLYEPFGIVFVEAMMAGLPIIALGVSSVPEIIKDGELGFVIKRGPNYIDNLAERLKIMLENDDIYDYFSKNSSAEAEKYSLASHVVEFKDLYAKMKNDN